MQPKTKKQFFLLVIIIYVFCACSLIYFLVQRIDKQYIDQAQNSLGDTAKLIAALIKPHGGDGMRGGSYIRDTLEDQLLYMRSPANDTADKAEHQIDLRIYIVDKQGWLIYDSWDLPIGENYTQQTDVMQALKGQQGVRMVQENVGGIKETFIYVSLPLRGESGVVGAIGLGKPLDSYAPYYAGVRVQTLLLVLISGVATVVFFLLVVCWRRQSNIDIPEKNAPTIVSTESNHFVHKMDEEITSSQEIVAHGLAEDSKENVSETNDLENEDKEDEISVKAQGATNSDMPFEYYPQRMQIKFYGVSLDLSRYEYKLLSTFIENPAQVFTRDELLDMVWGQDSENLDRTVDAHIKTLRAKLKAVAPDVQVIRTVRGFGYALNDEWP